MTRLEFIERELRKIYGGQPSADANITNNLVNSWLSDAIAIAAKQNYTDSVKLDGISFVNNSFYTTFKALTITADSSIGNFIYKSTLPQIPVGIGKNEGISTVQLKDSGNVSQTCIPMSMNQMAYINSLPPIPNKILYWSEGITVYFLSTLPIYNMTAIVRMISGGDATDLTSVLNVPSDYFPIMVEYVDKMLLAERSIKPDTTNDGEDLGLNK